jgi:CheY-like chemotaxis protein
MLKKVYDVKIIGTGLAILYAASLLIFMQFSGVADLPFRTYFYIFLFGVLFIGALAVVSLQEWGRKLVVAMNAVMFFCLFARYIPRIDLVPLAYIFMNIIVFLYFNQSNIRFYFHGKKFDKWHSILVIDDDEILLKTIRPLLISHGCSVLTAASGEEGLQIVKTQKPDMVILDVLLPKMKGREVCKTLKEDESTKDIPVIFLTAKDSPEDIQAEKEAGAAAHLTKPLNPRQLIATIRSILEPKRGHA